MSANAQTLPRALSDGQFQTEPIYKSPRPDDDLDKFCSFMLFGEEAGLYIASASRSFQGLSTSNISRIRFLGCSCNAPIVSRLDIYSRCGLFVRDERECCVEEANSKRRSCSV